MRLTPVRNRPFYVVVGPSLLMRLDECRLDDKQCDVVGVMPQPLAFRDDRVTILTTVANDTEK